MKRKILILTILTMILLLSMPFISSVQTQSLINSVGINDLSNPLWTRENAALALYNPSRFCISIDNPNLIDYDTTYYDVTISGNVGDGYCVLIPGIRILITNAFLSCLNVFPPSFPLMRNIISTFVFLFIANLPGSRIYQPGEDFHIHLDEMSKATCYYPNPPIFLACSGMAIEAD